MGQRRSFRIKQGLDLPITGECQQVIEDARPVTQVAVVGTDYHDLRPTMAVEEGDDVCIGQLLFEDKRRSGIRFTSPAGGKVVAIHRGSKRRLLSVVIDVASSEESEAFEVGGKRPEDLEADTVRKALVESGLWTGLRTRPYSKVPLPDQVAHSIFKVPTKIARVRQQSYLDPMWTNLFSRDHMPIDHIISPEIEVARAVTRRLQVPGAFEMIPLADDKVKLLGVRCREDCPV